MTEKDTPYSDGLRLLALYEEYGPTLEKAYTLTGTTKQDEQVEPLSVIDVDYQDSTHFITARGPKPDSEGYTLKVDHVNKEVIHAHGPPSQQQAPGRVDTLNIKYKPPQLICGL